jgi:hypothetical protein
MKTFLGFFLILPFYLTSLDANSQTFTKSSIKVAVGYGGAESAGKTARGNGYLFSAGYQRELGTGRFRINPQFSAGSYSSSTEYMNCYFGSYNLQMNLYADAIKIKSFSFITGTGLFINNTRGVINYNDQMVSEESAPFSDVHFGAYFGAGFRLNIPKQRIAFELMPLNILFGSTYFQEVSARIGVDIKL